MSGIQDFEADLLTFKSFRTLGEAMMTCSKDGGQLASFKTCDEINLAMDNLRLLRYPNDTIYQIGIFGNLKDGTSSRSLTSDFVTNA